MDDSDVMIVNLLMDVVIADINMFGAWMEYSVVLQESYSTVVVAEEQ
jgi:hypothetical protein